MNLLLKLLALVFWAVCMSAPVLAAEPVAQIDTSTPAPDGSLTPEQTSPIITSAATPPPAANPAPSIKPAAAPKTTTTTTVITTPGTPTPTR